MKITSVAVGGAARERGGEEKGIRGEREETRVNGGERRKKRGEGRK